MCIYIYTHYKAVGMKAARPAPMLPTKSGNS